MIVMFAVENNAGLESKLDCRFGRAAYFLYYDTDEKKILAVDENEFKNEDSGVGIKIGTMAIEKKCGAVIGAQTGPKLTEILKEAGVKLIVRNEGTVRDALELL
jgi:predicted Fe-Mo cluster-binding NifX family protein